MATNHTTNYQFNLWEPGDTFSRAEFNENSQKVDSALAAHDASLGEKLRLVIGSYTGTGKYGAENPNSISVPGAERPPRFIVIVQDDGHYRARLIRGMTKAETFCWNGSHHRVNLTWTDNGVSWYDISNNADVQLNTKNVTYCYAVFI